jgi:hypothetical protein
MIGCGLSMINEFETGKRTPAQPNILAIQHVLEERGITFIPATSDLQGGIIGPE